MNPFAFGVMSCRLPESLKLPGVIELGETRANRGSLVIGHGFWSFCTTDNAKRSTTTNFSSFNSDRKIISELARKYLLCDHVQDSWKSGSAWPAGAI